MAHSAQAKKRIRQNEKRRLINMGRRNEIRTLTKRYISLVEEKDAAGAKEIFAQLTSRLDKAARKNLYHKNNVARKKSRMAQLLLTIQA